MDALRQTITVKNRLGLHVRPAKELSKVAYDFDAVVALSKGDRTAHAHSVVELMTLGIYDGDELSIEAIGFEAEEALNAVIHVLTAHSDHGVERSACII